MTDDYQYGDEYDWDREDPSQYCRHGSFIGSWWGPDLMCMSCEMGDSDPTLNEMIENVDKKIRSLNASHLDIWPFVKNNINDDKYDNHKQAIVEFILGYTDHLDSQVKECQKRRQEIIEKYSPYSDNWETDRDILYKMHRAEIEEFLQATNRSK